MSINDAFESGEKTRAKSHFKNLLSVALADGILDKVELEYLFKMSSRFYITRGELESLISNPSSITFNPPTDKEERQRQLYNLVNMMMIDGEIDSREMELCMSFGVGLGFSSSNIDKLIQDVVKCIEAGEDKEDVLEKMDKLGK